MKQFIMNQAVRKTALHLASGLARIGAVAVTSMFTQRVLRQSVDNYVTVLATEIGEVRSAFSK
jgi:hypothetical protein